MPPHSHTSQRLGRRYTAACAWWATVSWVRSLNSRSTTSSVNPLLRPFCLLPLWERPRRSILESRHRRLVPPTLYQNKRKPSTINTNTQRCAITKTLPTPAARQHTEMDTIILSNISWYHILYHWIVATMNPLTYCSLFFSLVYFC